MFVIDLHTGARDQVVVFVEDDTLLQELERSRYKDHCSGTFSRSVT